MTILPSLIPTPASSSAGAPGLKRLSEPIRAEVLGAEALEQRGEELGARDAGAGVRRGRPLLARLKENRAALRAARATLEQAVEERRAITFGAAWLVDNFYLVLEQERQVRQDLSPRFYRELPKLESPPWDGLPRVYALAWTFVAHTDSRFDPDLLLAFVRGYQRSAPLAIGELWAIGIHLRIALIENLRRLADGVVDRLAARERADRVADAALGFAAESAEGRVGSSGRRPGPTEPDARSLDLSPESADLAYAVQLLERLPDEDPKNDPNGDPQDGPKESDPTSPLGRLRARLAELGTTEEGIVRLEHQRQAATQVSVANVIYSMRRIAAYDWAQFVEDASLVDDALRGDPAGIYARLDFESRDLYRHAIEELARGARRSEHEVARLAVERARSAPALPNKTASALPDKTAPALPDKTASAFPDKTAGTASASSSSTGEATRDATRDATADPAARHVGHPLVGAGRRSFEREIGFRPGTRERLYRPAIRAGLPGYLGAAALTTAVLLAPALALLEGAGGAPAALIVLALAALVPVSDLAFSLVNRWVAALAPARRLPKLALPAGPTEDERTMVVVPTLFDASSIPEQIERLEVHYLANAEGDVTFALLADFPDADRERRDEDDALLAAARAGIAALNERYGPTPSGGPRFFLLHRRRLWNASEGRFMGWERKRGKLHELNRLLRGATDTTFEERPGGPPPEVPRGVRYVVTLDADTRLPAGAVRSMVGAMAHPLHRATFDPATGRVASGYGILQPRVVSLLPVYGEDSLYQKSFSGPTGVDPYVAAVSDVYQDLFGEGSFVGKGIYDVDAFERALAERAPENALLSHDLFEGGFARAGLLSDVVLFDEFPTHLLAGAARQSRWVRGDWQLLPWLRDQVPTAGGGRGSNPLSPLTRWKMIDNLRRSLAAPAALFLLAFGWVAVPWSPGGAWLWGLAVALLVALPNLLSTIVALLPSRRGIAKRTHLGALLDEIETASTQAAVALALMPARAAMRIDSILRTIWRLGVRRRLLEWVTAAQAGAAATLDLSDFYRRLWGAPAAALLVPAAVAIVRPSALSATLPFALAWLLAPALARRLSRPMDVVARPTLAPSEVGYLRRLARQSWAYFERFASAEENFLPPDNVQEDPQEKVAHRTSPTNVGLGLLAAVAAYDFGWIGRLELLERLEATFSTIDRLERYNGHLLNWFDTRTLETLPARYVSTVDSGNLCGHLIALSAACTELASASARSEARRQAALRGLADTFALLRGAVARIPPAGRSGGVGTRDLREGLGALARALQSAEGSSEADGADERSSLLEVGRSADVLIDVLAALNPSEGSASVPFAPAGQKALGPSTDGPGASGAANPAGSPTGARPRTRPPARQGSAGEALAWAEAVRSATAARERDLLGADEPGEEERIRGRFVELAARAERFARAMDFKFLLDPERQLLAIGYLVDDRRMDGSRYDLLASEARLASLVAIAKGDVPATHWFHLGRPLAPIGRGSALLSWSGSMFEYLMPSLVLLEPIRSLLGSTTRLAVGEQIRYAAEQGVPWGISESAKNERDLDLNYQYGPTGVPRLALKRPPRGELVVAPYATALAALVEPRAALANFERFDKIGVRGRYGFYEALDFTRRRVPEGEPFALIRSFMAHHQGMTLLALADVLSGGALKARFHRHPLGRAAELLLQERTPRDVVVARPMAEEKRSSRVRAEAHAGPRRLDSPHFETPRAHLLAGLDYAVLMTSSGAGWSRSRGLSVTRFREDATRDDSGSFLYLRDAGSGAVWSAGYQPTAVEPDRYRVLFSAEKVEIQRTDGAIASRLEMVVSTEESAELRRLTISNDGEEPRTIEITSFAEIALAPDRAVEAHPAFSKLFVKTEALRWPHALLATRRATSASGASTDPAPWAMHVLAVEGETFGPPEHETDRARFLGRGASLRRPLAIVEGRPLSGTAGFVLDPVFSLRRTLIVPPGGRVRALFATGLAASRDEAVRWAEKYAEVGSFQRAASLAWTLAQVEQRHAGLHPDEAHLFQRLAGDLAFTTPELRSPAAVLARNRLPIRALWGHGISGDLPLVLLRIDRIDDREIVRQTLLAHQFWRGKGLAADLVILNEQPSDYVAELQEELLRLVRAQPPARTGTASGAAGSTGPAGSVFVLRADQVPADQRDLLRTVARVVLSAREGSLSEQLRRHVPARVPPPPGPVREPAPPEVRRLEAPPERELSEWNGIGGFARDGREYAIVQKPGQRTPLPWINVIANPRFGCQISESGAGYTWSENARENRLSPWSNDPIADPPGEAIYVRDDETGVLWSPTALPIREEEGTYVCRHGQGWSRFAYDGHGVALELLVFVAPSDPVRVARLRLENLSSRRRRLSVAAYVEWVLGNARPASGPFVVTERDERTGALLAHNRLSDDFAERVAFAWLSGHRIASTADRREFLGRHGTLEAPAGLLTRTVWSGRTGAGLDPCAALASRVDLLPGGTAEVTFLLGQGADRAGALDLLARYTRADVSALLADVETSWDQVLGALVARTPDPAFDRMVDRWLLYQALSSRIWGRTAFYQSSGAFGFRDQLQDSMAFVLAKPELARAQLLRAAARQFHEGDVQHWWHEPSGRGIRTLCSDDLLWLPFAAAHYVAATADRAVLDESLPFLEQPAIPEGQHEDYRQPLISAEVGSLYEHCARAIDRSLVAGPHGLPRIGSCDWNDGFSKVGLEGKGESIWLGWFLLAVIDGFAPIAEARGEGPRAESWRARASSLRAALETSGWDGGWYRRAYYDDGAPLGSAGDAECRIDSIAQSWGAISGAAEPGRAHRAMMAVDALLVERGNGLIRLFAPPFDPETRTGAGHDPGYIQDYPPGVRENGGQYTHAAIWTVIAFAMLGDGDRAGELFALINPIHHTSTRAGVYRYKTEPYVVAADVYAEPPHIGRGGWTWYTGSAAWMYRAAVEWILGVRKRGDRLVVDPCIPRAWRGFSVEVRHGTARYLVQVENPRAVMKGVVSRELDGAPVEGEEIPLADDGREHAVRIILG